VPTILSSSHKYVLPNATINTVVWLDFIRINPGANADRELRVNMTTFRVSMTFLRLNSSRAREDETLQEPGVFALVRSRDQATASDLGINYFRILHI
jgi:hypothetical protein